MALVPDETVEFREGEYPDGDEIWVVVPVNLHVLESKPADWCKERLGEIAYDTAVLQIAQEQENQDGTE